MTRLVWDALDAREFSFGVEKGVLYPKNSSPVVWNGLVSVSEEPDDAEAKVYYYDGESYVKQRASEGFAASIDAVTYPDVLDDEVVFDFSYSVNTQDGTAIHLVYNARLVQTDKTHSTMNNQAEIETFSWRMTTIPERINPYRATAHLVISTTRSNQSTLASLTDLLYGTDTSEPSMPTVEEVIGLYDGTAIFVVTDNGDGTWTATGPDSWFEMLDATTFKITSPSAEYIDSETYRIHSW